MFQCHFPFCLSQQITSAALIAMQTWPGQPRSKTSDPFPSDSRCLRPARVRTGKYLLPMTPDHPNRIQPVGPGSLPPTPSGQGGPQAVDFRAYPHGGLAGHGVLGGRLLELRLGEVGLAAPARVPRTHAGPGPVLWPGWVCFTAVGGEDGRGFCFGVAWANEPWFCLVGAPRETKSHTS